MNFIAGFIWFVIMQVLAYVIIGRTLGFFESLIAWPIFMIVSANVIKLIR